MKVQELLENTTEYRINILNPVDAKISRTYLFLKRFFDILLSFIAIVVFSIPMLCIAILIKATSKGPAIYKQERVGRDEKPFTIYKFRTMISGADNLEEHLSPVLLEIYKKNRKLINDPRITKIGSLLRRTSLDELPQIFNIFKGDMSIVGPRPMMPEEIEMYGQFYDQYVTVKPGLTGLWQTKCRSATSMEDRARLDHEYINKMGILFDIIIIFKTIGVVLSKKGAC